MKVVFKHPSSSQDHVVDLDAAGVTALYADNVATVRVYQSSSSWTEKKCLIMSRKLDVSENQPFIEVMVSDY